MIEEDYRPKPPLPMPDYEPLMVTPVDSKKKPGEVIAFIDRQLCFFEREAPAPPVGTPIEVMILKPLYHRKDVQGFDFHRIFALILRAVTPDWTLIEHDGFECSGSMCRTTARMTGPKNLIDARGRGIGPWLTPGRSEIFEAGNVNSGWTWKQPYTPRRPGKAWVSTDKLTAGEFPLRIEGLARVEDGEYARAVKSAERKTEVTT